MNPGRNRRLVTALAGSVLFTAIAGQFWRNLLGWWGWGAIALLALAVSIWMLAAHRPRLALRRIPASTMLFTLVAALSIAWSSFRGATVLGFAAYAAVAVAALFLALCLSWGEFVAALAGALRWTLVLSIAFELWVAWIVRGPLLPNFTHYEGTVPAAFYWSRDLLFRGGPIDGILANRNLLGMAALLLLALTILQLASGLVRRTAGAGWIGLSVLVLLLTRSATVLAAGLLVAVALGFALWMRRRSPQARRPVYATAVALGAAALAALAVAWPAILSLFGRSEDLTGRLDIWGAVWGLIVQKPWFGWGWLGYWPPWVAPFDDLAVRKGVVYLQAHNAWLDVWMQLGVLGLVLLFAVVGGALWRSWFLAIDRPRDAVGGPLPYRAISLVPLAITVALIGQSFAESRMLTEGGLLLLLSVALVTKQRQWHHEPLPVEASEPRGIRPGPWNGRVRTDLGPGPAG